MYNIGESLGGLGLYIYAGVVYIDASSNGSVYIPSLRLGGRKLPTYELTLRLLGVVTMYGSVYIASLRLGGRKLPRY